MEPFEKIVRDAIGQRVREIVAIEARKASIAVEEQVRMEMGAIATRVLSCVQMHTDDKHMVITVDFKNLRNG